MVEADPGREAVATRVAGHLKVFLLGRFEVVRDDAPIPPQAWRRRRPADLLKLVALTPGRVLSRDAVIETLWPDKDPASGANNLHRALYDLRQILGSRTVDIEHGQVSLHPEAWVDVDAFQAAATSPLPAARESAVALYRGDLSPEDPASPWLVERRAQLRALLADAAFPLARAAAERGDPLIALSLLRRVLDVAPAHTAAAALAMRLLAEVGRRADALRQYDACEAALQVQGLGPPGDELRGLREAVLRGEVGPAPARQAYDGYRRAARRLLGTSDPPPLRGRAGTLLLFESLVEQGTGALVLLGERGVGMTRLAVEGARIAQAAGAVVVTGVCDPARGTPFAPLADLFADYLRAGGSGQDPFAQPPAPAAGSLAQERARISAAVKERLAAIGGGRPLYVLLDDLHDADESTANLVHDLARAARALRLMLVATCREDAVRFGTPVQMLLAHLDCERVARGVRVQRLDLQASRDQLADLLGAPPGDTLAAQLYRLTDGSPLRTELLARAFKESGQLQLASSATESLRQRVTRLGPRAAAVLESAAVAGRRFDFDVVRAASGLSGHEALTALEQLLEARFVDEDGPGYRFHHELVRDALYQGLTPARRVALHRAVADAIEARQERVGGGLDELAQPLADHRRAADQPDRAFAHLVAAGHRAAGRAGLSEAQGFYEAARSLADAAEAPGPRRLELLEALAQVQLTQADLPGAARSFGAAAALQDASGWRPSPEQRAHARRGAALALMSGGRLSEARVELDAALTEAPGADERAETLYLLAQLALHASSPAEALELAQRCVDEGARAGDGALAERGRDLAAIASALLGLPPPPAAAAGVDAPADAYEVHLLLWQNDLLGHRPLSELSTAVAALRQRAAQRQVPMALAMAYAFEGSVALRGGRLDLAEPALREAQRLFQGSTFALGEAFAVDCLGELLTLRGQTDQAMDLLGHGLVLSERASQRLHVMTCLHATLARNRLAAGAVYAAEDAIHEASAVLARHGECTTCHAHFRAALARVCLARGRLDEAAAEVAELEALATRSGGRGLAALARLARAHLLLSRQEPVEAAAAAEEAATGFDALGARLDAARARSVGSRALQLHGGREHAERAAALALRAADVLGPAGVFPER